MDLWSQDHIQTTVASPAVPLILESLNEQKMGDGMARSFLWPSWRFLSEAAHHDRGAEAGMVNCTNSSSYQKAPVALWGRAVSTGMKTLDSPGPHVDIPRLQSLSHIIQNSNVFSQREHWTFLSKHKFKLHIHKTVYKERRKKGERKRSRRREGKKEMENEKSGLEMKIWNLIVALPRMKFFGNSPFMIRTNPNSFLYVQNFGSFISKSSPLRPTSVCGPPAPPHPQKRREKPSSWTLIDHPRASLVERASFRQRLSELREFSKTDTEIWELFSNFK